jgi:hypothetical protein
LRLHHFILRRGLKAYFVAFTGKVTIYISSPELNVLSNPISLRIVPPENITDISLVDDSLWPPIAAT